MQRDLRRAKWQYVCRTDPNILLTAYGVELRVGDIQPKRGELLAITPARITAKLYGPISLLALWEQPYEQAIYLITNIDDLNEALQRE